MRKLFTVILAVLLLSGCNRGVEQATEMVTAPPVYAQDWTAMLSACAHGVGFSGTEDVTDAAFAACFMETLQKQGISGRYEQFVQCGIMPKAGAVQHMSALYAFRTDVPQTDNGDGTYTQVGTLIRISTAAMEELETYAVTAAAAPDQPLGLLLLRIEKV